MSAAVKQKKVATYYSKNYENDNDLAMSHVIDYAQQTEEAWRKDTKYLIDKAEQLSMTYGQNVYANNL